MDPSVPIVQPDLLAARMQMALSLGWHIVIACFGVGFPALILVAEWLGIRRDDVTYLRLARRWAKAAGVLFAVGAVSGTILSFEMGILWPGLMGTFGEVIGLPFALEGIAFFIEAIFLGIYLYSWDRLPPRIHNLTGLPVVAAGVASAWFVVTANAWMNQPAGFTLVDGVVTNVDPLAAMLNPATAVQTTHLIIAAFMVAGFGVASAYAWALLRGRRGQYAERRGFLLGFAMAAILTGPQILVGDWAAQTIARQQPAKLAALEALYETQRGAPLRWRHPCRWQSRARHPDPKRLVLARVSRRERRSARTRGVPRGRAAAGPPCPHRLPGDGRDRVWSVRPGALARVGLVAEAGLAEITLVPHRCHRCRPGSGDRSRGGLDRDRGRTSALDRVRDHAR